MCIFHGVLWHRRESYSSAKGAMHLLNLGLRPYSLHAVAALAVRAALRTELSKGLDSSRQVNMIKLMIKCRFFPLYQIWMASFILSWNVVEAWSRMLKQSLEHEVRHRSEFFKCLKMWEVLGYHVSMCSRTRVEKCRVVSYKMGLIRRLVDRAYKINNTWLGFTRISRNLPISFKRIFFLFI